MLVILNHTVNRVKNGFSASSIQLGIAAHGHSPEVAASNLEYSALLMLKPLARQGILAEELARLGMQVQSQDEVGLVVVAQER